jgi:hypothetical protein
LNPSFDPQPSEPDGEYHLLGLFVTHFRQRDDDILPIATLPVVLPDRTFLADRGLHRKLGTVFRVPDELMALLPKTRCRNEPWLRARGK